MDIIVGDIGSYIKDQQKCIQALAIVRDVCRARPNGYKFMPKYKQGHWDGYISLMLSFSMFPTGLLSIVVSALESRGYHVYVERVPLSEHSIVVPEFLNGIILRDYQIDAANKLLDTGRGIARMATNSGKTEVMAAIIKALNQKSLIVLHRKELMYQTADRLSKRLGTEIGMIGDGVWEYKFITVAMIQTLSNAKDLSMFHDTSVVIVDECFVAGTLVDGKTIESIQVGDMITAFDCYGHLHKANVTRCFVKRAPCKLYRLYFGDSVIVCTSNHAFLTTNGWMTADSLTLGVQVYVYNTLPLLPQNNPQSKSLYENAPRCRLSNTLWSILSKLYTSCGNSETHDCKQSNIQRRSEGENQCIITGDSSQATDSWGEWDRTGITTEIIGRRIGMGNGNKHTDKKVETFRLSNKLQSGHRLQEIEVGNRGGWTESLFTESSGSEKRCLVETVGLDSIEILQSGSEGEYEEVCPDGCVYNIEVEKYHTYFANGLAVHNCHHTGSDQMMNVLGKIPGRYRFGFSGTPLKGDVLADMKLISATGDVVCDVTNRELIDGGYSAKPVIKMCIIEREGDDDWELIYRKAYTSLIVENEYRNNRIVEFAKESVGTVLILVSRLDHGRKLRDMIPGSVFIHGSDTSEYRMEMLSHMRDHSGVFIASPIFDEGIDVPRVDTVILACGGKSYVKLLQRIGRGMRKKDDGKNELIIIDFIDDTNKHLLKHSDRRIKTYVSEGFDAKVVDAKPGIVLHKST